MGLRWPWKGNIVELSPELEKLSHGTLNYIQTEFNCPPAPGFIPVYTLNFKLTNAFFSKRCTINAFQPLIACNSMTRCCPDVSPSEGSTTASSSCKISFCKSASNSIPGSDSSGGTSTEVDTNSNPSCARSGWRPRFSWRRRPRLALAASILSRPRLSEHSVDPATVTSCMNSHAATVAGDT